MIFAETERLILRRPRAADHEAFLRSWDDPQMTRYTIPRINVGQFVAELIAEMESKQPGETGPNGSWYQVTMELKESGAVVGDIGVGFEVPGERQVELGYRVHPDYQRLGLGREAVAAIIDWLVAEHEIHRFVGIVAAPHQASIALLKALGFRQEGHFRQSFWCGGEWLDDLYFALLASEWRGLQPPALRRR